MKNEELSEQKADLESKINSLRSDYDRVEKEVKKLQANAANGNEVSSALDFERNFTFCFSIT